MKLAGTWGHQPVLQAGGCQQSVPKSSLCRATVRVAAFLKGANILVPDSLYNGSNGESNGKENGKWNGNYGYIGIYRDNYQ